MPRLSSTALALLLSAAATAAESRRLTRVPLNITLRDSLIIRPFRPVLYLTEAVYTPGANAPDCEDFSTAYTYDAAGNPLTAVRHGVVDMADDSETFGVLDSLAYSYDGNRVTEVENDCEGQKLYGRTCYPAAAGSYEWDDAGRMTADGARLISKITYDYRDLPKAVQLADGTTEANTYDAAGLRRFTMREYVADRVFSGSIVKSSMVYSYFPDGYFDADGAPHFLHTDYQGSVVMVTDSAGRVEQHTAYYPYGELFPIMHKYILSGTGGNI